MPVVYGKLDYRGVVDVSSLGVEYTIVEAPIMTDDYMIIGVIDCHEMEAGDEIRLALYATIDGVNTIILSSASYTYTDLKKDGTQAILVRPVYLPRDARARLTLTQTRGTPRRFPYWVALVEVDGRALKYIMRSIA